MAEPVTIEEGNAIARDVVRWRKLARLLQASYDAGRCVELSGDPSQYVDAVMAAQWHGERYIEVTIRFKDATDDQLGLGALLDALDLDAVLAEVKP